MLSTTQPLADKVRPQRIDQVVGQEHLVGFDKPLRKMVETGLVHSMIFWGPPGSGKTTLARVIANEIQANFYELSAVSAGKADVKRVIEKAQQPKLNIKNQQSNISRNILFLDEIHRFNKAQQDFLLPYVEDGTLILIGATTENPSFEVISALLSRSQVFVLNGHSKENLHQIIDMALVSWSQALGANPPTLADEAKDFLAEFANGDARTALNLLENTAMLYGKNRVRPHTDRTQNIITVDDLKNTLQSKHLRYDTKWEEHYNTISAFIKSMRASNVDAALYYLARMVEAGEDPKFIARRMVIFASEDVGIAVPTALVVANEVFRAVEIIGYPECAINLAHGVAYLAQCKKDRSAYDAYFSALDDVKKFGNLPIPLNLRNAPTKLMKELGYGKGYEQYSKENLLPDRLKNKSYFEGEK